MTPPYEGNPVATLIDDLSEGSVALISGRIGVGTAGLLIHAGLGALLTDRQVLHVAVDESVHHVRAHYDEMLRVLGGRIHVPRHAVVVERGRMVHSFRDRAFDVAVLDAQLDVLASAAAFAPSLVLIDGLAVDHDLEAKLVALKTLAESRGLRVFASVHTDVPLPARLFEVPELAIRLVPDGVRVHLERAHGQIGDHLPVALEPSSLIPIEEQRPVAPTERVAPRDCTLYSGGAAGSEAAFGVAAQRWGLREVAFTFEGHLQSRTEGRHELSPRELAMGDVSLAYVSKRLNRSYNDRGGLIRGVLQTIWHMVSRSHQVFVVGTIQDDGTVRGGTGWAVELARMWSRELWVFDEPRGLWHRWDNHSWTPGTPTITTPHLCGTGTRQITDAGRHAIETLFESSFREG